MSGKALETVAYAFGLIEHELAHQGDSLDCGHDEAFYPRPMLELEKWAERMPIDECVFENYWPSDRPATETPRDE